MNSKLIYCGVLALLLILPLSLSAQTYLVGIPGISDPGLSFGSYINALYALSISIGALMAVIKIIIAGVRYMLSDIVTSKSEAISDIRGAVLGLLIVISAVVVLQEINPQLVETNIFLDKVVTPPNVIVTTPGSAPVVKTGYSYIQVSGNSAAVQTFRAACETAAGLLTTGSLPNGKSQVVCYDDVSAANLSWLSGTFGSRFSNNLITRFQIFHFTRPFARTSVPASTLPANKVVEFAVQFVLPGDWIEKGQQSAMNQTCRDLQAAIGRTMTVHGSAALGYLACIRDI